MNSENRDALVLRGAVHAAVLVAGSHLGVTTAQAEDITARLIAEARPELTSIGTVRLSGETISDALARLADDPQAAHLFAAQADVSAQAKIAERARLKAMPAGARLEAVNSDEGVFSRRGRQFREGCQ